MISLISILSLKLYLNSLVYDRNIFGSSSKVYGNLRLSSEIFGKCSATFVRHSEKILESLRKSSESGRKSSEKRQFRRHFICLYNKKNNTSHSFAALTCEILFLPLEHKIHIFSPPCIVLYVLNNRASLTYTLVGVQTVFQWNLDITKGQLQGIGQMYSL